MATRKLRVKVIDFMPSLYTIYLAIADDALDELQSIEGIVEVGEQFSAATRRVMISPLYDANEIRQEIEALNGKNGVMDIIKEAFAK